MRGGFSTHSPRRACCAASCAAIFLHHPPAFERRAACSRRAFPLTRHFAVSSFCPPRLFLALRRQETHARLDPIRERETETETHARIDPSRERERQRQKRARDARETPYTVAVRGPFRWRYHARRVASLGLGLVCRALLCGRRVAGGCCAGLCCRVAVALCRFVTSRRRPSPRLAVAAAAGILESVSQIQLQPLRVCAPRSCLRRRRAARSHPAAKRCRTNPCTNPWKACRRPQTNNFPGIRRPP